MGIALQLTKSTTHVTSLVGKLTGVVQRGSPFPRLRGLGLEKLLEKCARGCSKSLVLFQKALDSRPLVAGEISKCERACGKSSVPFKDVITKASRTSWLVVLCERSERLGGLGRLLDETY